MDTISLIIGLGLLALFTIPIVYLVRLGNAQNSSIIKQANSFAAQHHLKLDELEQVGCCTIGLDVSQKKLIFTHPKNNGTFELIDLTAYSALSLRQELQSSNSNRIQYLSLHFIENRTQFEKFICFYDESGEDITSPEIRLQQARKWEHKITPLLAA